MLSDHEVLSLVLKHMARVARGEASEQLAGEELMRELLRAGRTPHADDGA